MNETIIDVYEHYSEVYQVQEDVLIDVDVTVDTQARADIAALQALVEGLAPSWNDLVDGYRVLPTQVHVGASSEIWRYEYNARFGAPVVLFREVPFDGVSPPDTFYTEFDAVTATLGGVIVAAKMIELDL